MGAPHPDTIPFLQRPRVYRASLFLIALGYLIVAIQLYGKVAEQENDLDAYVLASDALLAGESPYGADSRFPFIYPAFFALVMIPFALLPHLVVDYAWFLFNAVLLTALCAVVFRRCHRLFGTPWDRRLVPLAAGLMAINYGIFQNDFGNGQVNILITFLCVMFVECHFEGRRWAAAACLAAAIAIKLLPLAFAGYLVFRRDLKTLAATAGFTLAFSLLPAVFLGKDTVPIYKNYAERFIQGGATGQVQAPEGDTILSNQGITREKPRGVIYFSLSSTVARWVPSLAAWRGLTPLMAVLVGCMLLAASWGAQRAATAQAAYWESLLYFAAMLLIDPMCQTHHLVMLFPASIALAAALLFRPSLAGPRGTQIAVALLALQALAMAVKFGPFKFLLVAGATAVLLLLVFKRQPATPKQSPARGSTDLPEISPMWSTAR